MLKKLLILTLQLAGTTAFAQSPDNGICAEYSGKAFGICISATNNECGTENERNEHACDNMENNFIDATGEMPPWLRCPCWTPEELASVDGISPNGDTALNFRCSDYPTWQGIDEEGYDVAGVRVDIASRAGPAGGHSGGYCIFATVINFDYYNQIRKELAVDEGTLTNEQADTCAALHAEHYETVCN